MAPGFYVVRMPVRGAGSRLIVESVCFTIRSDAENWAGFIKELHPKDEVFVIERLNET